MRKWRADGHHRFCPGLGGVNHLVDATIRARGVSIVATDERGQMQGVQLVVPSMQFVEVQQPPVDSALLPPVSIDSLLANTRTERINSSCKNCWDCHWICQ